MSQSVAQSLSNNSANFLTTSSVRPFSNNLNSNMMNNNQQGPLGILGGTSLLPSTSSGNNSNTFVTAGNSNTRPYFSVSNNTNNNNGKAALNSLGREFFNQHRRFKSIHSTPTSNFTSNITPQNQTNSNTVTAKRSTLVASSKRTTTTTSSVGGKRPQSATTPRLQNGPNAVSASPSNNSSNIMYFKYSSTPQEGQNSAVMNGNNQPDERVPNRFTRGNSPKINYLMSQNTPQVKEKTVESKIEETVSNERLNLDRRNLTKCPIITGDTNLKLLNLQYNEIRSISNLNNLTSLVFLDLYGNKIKKISNLDSLLSLRVLMLGKNMIEKIEGLEYLHKLDVLDLHGNKIREISNLSSLKEVRVLNLAGNLISNVSNVRGLQSLNELNLRKNMIEKVEEIDELPNLKRLFLSSNNIQLFASVESVLRSTSLTELSMDDNPLQQNLGQKYRVITLASMRKLVILDSTKVVESERDVSLKYLANVNVSSIFPFTDLIPSPLEYGQDLNIEINLASSHPPDAQDISPTPPTPNLDIITAFAKEKEENHMPEVAISSYTQIEGEMLHIYGEPFITPINYGDYNVHFHNLGLEKICETFLFTKKIMASSLTFSNNNISSLKQLSLLSKLDFVVTKISFKDNPVCSSLKRILKPYCIYVLPQLVEMNGKPISSTDKSNSEKIFGKRQAVAKQIPIPVANNVLDRYSGIINPYIKSVLNHTYIVQEKMKLVDEVWDSVMFDFIMHSLNSLDKGSSKQNSDMLFKKAKSGD
ncbi:leucine rich repeat protein [Naegleria gruberi]|uniref:Leucine rich repeat protein n=1 Tax=Naegleria gruberi TaxID=5762 RepID=D2V4W7_NAEGR|nr:leucine rich repeat protein [Naegleria gruberi]EFC48177.1 leucine rich repeat protein [Naegleria gruberi]|eukprot:XP_002680921.1 leucine rich repeat protein [Naegleria gruberi strain NEG-M]